MLRKLYRFVDHTSELELAIESDSEAGVLAEAVAALGQVLAADEWSPEGPAERREVEARAHDRPALLAAFVEELLFLAERDGFVPERATGVSLAPDAVRATVEGRTGWSGGHVKAVTFHRLAFGEADGHWLGRVVLDV